MTTYYVDTSVGMHLLTGVSPKASAWFEEVMANDEDQVLSSRILQTEMVRTCRRDGDDPQRAQEFAAAIDLVPISDAVLRFAEMIEPHIKTLDAIHVATALLLGDPEAITLVTHDSHMKKVARSLGFEVFDPVEAA